MGTEKERQRCVFWNNHSSDRVEESATSHLPPSSPHFISLHPWIQLHLQTLHPFISSLFLSRVPFLLCLTISSALSLSFCHYLSLLHPLLTLFFTLFFIWLALPLFPLPPTFTNYCLFCVCGCCNGVLVGSGSEQKGNNY